MLLAFLQQVGREPANWECAAAVPVPVKKQGLRFGRPLDSAGVRFGRPCERSSHIAPKVTSGPLAGCHPRDGAARHL